MSEIIQCDKCKCDILENKYGIRPAHHLTLEILKNGIWCRYHGHLCEPCKNEFFKWLGVKE